MISRRSARLLQCLCEFILFPWRMAQSGRPRDNLILHAASRTLPSFFRRSWVSFAARQSAAYAGRQSERWETLFYLVPFPSFLLTLMFVRCSRNELRRYFPGWDMAWLTCDVEETSKEFKSMYIYVGTKKGTAICLDFAKLTERKKCRKATYSKCALYCLSTTCELCTTFLQR